VSTTERVPGRCLVCQTIGPVQRHHVARAVNLSVTVPLCRSCHRRLWDHESIAGVHRKGESAAGQAWAILHGFLALAAVAAGEWAEDLAETRGAMLTLLCSLTDETVGPNPVTATTRHLVERETEGGTDASVAFTAGLLDAMAAAITEWLGDGELAGFAAQLAASAVQSSMDARPADVETTRRLTADAVSLARQLTALEDETTGAGELADRLHDFDADTRDFLRRISV
jgi:hypothetical protein